MASVTHYASVTVGDDDLFGTAELTSDGYVFRPDDASQAMFIRSQDVNRPYRLMLYGRVDLATEQYIEDEIRGGLVGVCLSRAQEVA